MLIGVFICNKLCSLSDIDVDLSMFGHVSCKGMRSFPSPPSILQEVISSDNSLLLDVIPSMVADKS